MSDQGTLSRDSWILYYVLNKLMGSKDMIAIKRKLTIVTEQIGNVGKQPDGIIYTGSSAEGVDIGGSDRDFMFIDNNVLVMCPHQDTDAIHDIANTTVFMMRDTNRRPGYVTLELVKIGHCIERHDMLLKSNVPVDDLCFISSEMYRRSHSEESSDVFQMTMDTHGPATAISSKHSRVGIDVDVVYAFRCTSWPTEADEWVSRPRLHDWPDKVLRDQIVQDGCYLVPVGDKTSPDTFLQWRISFAHSERKLIHSVTHVQFLVYCLLKYLLKQISTKLEHIYGDADILSSYFIKIKLFHALEYTPKAFWEERNTFLCFMLCLNILTSWVKMGNCPNYFIYKNNMFTGKVHGENQEKLLHFLTELHNMTWGCLSIETTTKPSIGEYMHHVKHGTWQIVLATPARLERQCDLKIVRKTMSVCVTRTFSGLLKLLCELLCQSKSDMDEYVAYYHMVGELCHKGME